MPETDDTMPNDSSDADSNGSKDPSAQLKKIGLMVLLAGVVIGGMIYILFPDQSPSDENSLMSQYYKRQELDAQRMWGTQGSLVLGFTRSLQKPSTWSVIIIVLAALVALACFFLANRPAGKRE